MGGDNIRTEKVILENFRSFGELLYVIGNRPNNKVMNGKDSSVSGTKNFTGTGNYKEAIKLLQSGYTDAATKLKTNIKQKDKIQSKFSAMTEHPLPHNAVVGYIPNVPNAIRNLPNSMITIERKPMKRKTLHILYNMGANSDKPVDYFIKAGVALLSAINLIEKSGVQVKIDIAFFVSESGDELTFPTVNIKNYGERYSFQKISFPLVHPSMFRRFGFKWLETTPEITNTGFRCGYGHAPSTSYVEEVLGNNLKGKFDKNTYYVDSQWINDHDCSVEEILKRFEVV